MGVTADAGFYSIIDYTVDGPETQREVVEVFAGIQERWVRHHPGYRSARFLSSTDGTRVCALVHWASQADLRQFEESADTADLMEAIQKALDGLSGRVEPRMSRYTVLREITPGPPRAV